MFLVHAVTALFLSMTSRKKSPFLAGMALCAALVGGFIGALLVIETQEKEPKKVIAARDACCTDDLEAE